MKKSLNYLSAALIFLVLALTFSLSPGTPTVQAVQTCEDCQAKCQRKFDQCGFSQHCSDKFNECIVQCFRHFCEQ